MHPEVERRLVHVTGAVVPLAWFVDLVPWWGVQVVWTGGAAVALVLEALRLSGRLNWRIFAKLTREYEQENLAGYALYMLSMAAVSWLFVPTVAAPGMLMLAVGDPISGLLGSGELRSMKQATSLLAMFGVCLLIALAFVSTIPAILGAAAATLADGVKPVVRGYVVDDNLTIPPAAAVGITVGILLV
ncbi:dolichol kinase [Halomarina litorea]|uniref:dolichol kinase n=1 Tax=Halomarina litorea TaxID=2961595 RepID=UPI0020C3225C|nr:dolichol kinase [Halomarina sp. BCD28]